MIRAKIAILCFLCVCGQAWGQTLKRVATIDLPGAAGQRFDYLTVDYEDHYLLSAHLGHVEPNVHSRAVDAETHRVYAPEEQEAGKPVARMVVYEAVP